MLLDDELPSLKYLKLLCQQIPEIEVIKAFNSSLDFLAQHADIEFDLLITDIEMPHIKGLELAGRIKNKAIIFTTAYGEYAADAFDLQVIDYVRKPLKLERLKQAIAKVSIWQRNTIPTEKAFIQVNSDKGKYLLYFDRIHFITTSNLDSRDKAVVLDDKSEITLKNVSFQTLESDLPSSAFCRINKKEIIALHIVAAFSHNEITSNLQGDNKQPRMFTLSDKYKTIFLQKLTL